MHAENNILEQTTHKIGDLLFALGRKAHGLHVTLFALDNGTVQIEVVPENAKGGIMTYADKAIAKALASGGQIVGIAVGIAIEDKEGRPGLACFATTSDMQAQSTLFCHFTNEDGCADWHPTRCVMADMGLDDVVMAVAGAWSYVCDEGAAVVTEPALA